MRVADQDRRADRSGLSTPRRRRGFAIGRSRRGKVSPSQPCSLCGMAPGRGRAFIRQPSPQAWQARPCRRLAWRRGKRRLPAREDAKAIMRSTREQDLGANSAPSGGRHCRLGHQPALRQGQVPQAISDRLQVHHRIDHSFRAQRRPRAVERQQNRAFIIERVGWGRFGRQTSSKNC